MREDLLGAQCHPDGRLGGKGKGFVKSVGMERLSATQHRSHRLVGDSGNVVERLLCGQGNSCGLTVEAHLQRTLVGGSVAFLQVTSPDASCCTQLGNFLEEVVVDIPEERESRSEVIDRQA